MLSSARQTITCILLVFSTAFCVQTQTPPTKAATASISGKVTIKGKPAVGVMIVATVSRGGYSSHFTGHRTRTDQTGTYRFTNLPATTYELASVTPALILANQSNTVVVSDGEIIEDFNLELVPGGVITGKISDPDGEPLVGELVRITPVETRFQRGSGLVVSLMARSNPTHHLTDDRGIYRLFGIPPGNYRVSAGQSDFNMGSSRGLYRATFYPSVSDPAKATVIEVKEGSETNDVDIVIRHAVETFRIAGRVVDAETGRPIPDIRYEVTRTIDHGQSGRSESSMSGRVTNADGEFRLEKASPGKYTIVAKPSEGSEMSAAFVSFELVDRDRTDLIIRMTRGGSLSGVVLFDGIESSPATLSRFQIYATVESTDSTSTSSSSTAVNQDGTFRINGVRSGLARLSLSFAGDNREQFEIIRVERNGVPQPINVKEREHVAGIRVTVKRLKLTGAIRGQVKAENGELPPVSQLWVLLWPLDENLQPTQRSSVPRPELDARGRFFVEGLPAGAYQLRVYVTTPGRTKKAEQPTQLVTVTDDTVTEVTLIIKPEPNND